MRSLTWKKLAFLLLLAVLHTPPEIGAQNVVYDNGNLGDVGPMMSGAGSLAVRFVASTFMEFDGVRYWGAEHVDDIFLDSINWWIFSDNGANGPSSSSYSGTATVTRSGDASSFPLAFPDRPEYEILYRYYQYDFGIGQTALGPGTYWLALQLRGDNRGWWRSTAAPYDPGDWVWQSGAGDGNFFSPYGDPMAGDPRDVAYQLVQSTTVTPEPISMALLGTGLAGIGIARRRRKKGSDLSS